jgi:transposase
VAHRNARLAVHGRMLLVHCVLSGRPVAHVTAELGVSRATGYKWLIRWRTEGPAGMCDRSSRAHRIPHRSPAELAQRIVALRWERKLGPARIAALVGLAARPCTRCWPASRGWTARPAR